MHGDPAQASIEILNAIGTPIIQYVIQSVPSVEYLLQRPLAVAQALVPVVVESAISIPIYLGISYVKPLIDQAVFSIGEVLNAATTLDPGATINALQHGVKDVAMRTIDLANATGAVVHDTRQAVRTALQTQPATTNLALERRVESVTPTDAGAGDDQDVALHVPGGGDGRLPGVDHACPSESALDLRQGQQGSARADRGELRRCGDRWYRYAGPGQDRVAGASVGEILREEGEVGTEQTGQGSRDNESSGSAGGGEE